MKKLFLLLSLAFLFITSGYAVDKKEVKETAKAVATAHQDVKEVASTLHQDLSTVYQDSKELVSTVYGDSKDLAKDLYPEVKSAVIAIAKGLGVAAEHVYSVLVKKFVVEGLVEAIPFVIGLVLLIIGWIKIEKYVKANQQIKWQILYPVALLTVGFLCICSVNYNTMLMGLVNPEFGAINYILDFTKDMIK